MASAKDSPEDLAAKTRIITHMNNDHHDSIIRFLQHHFSLSSLKAYSGTLTDISLTSLTLTCSGRIYTLPLNPPMTSYREARERMVAMDKKSRAALKQSPTTVRSFVPPTGSKYLPPFLVCMATFLGYSQRWWFAPSGPVARVLGEGFAAFSWRIQPWLLWGLFAIHGFEVLIFVNTALPKHSVNPRQRIWTLWAVSVFIEGVFAQKRFKDHVEKVSEKEKH